MLGTDLQAQELIECLVEGGFWRPLHFVNPGRQNNQIVQRKFSRQFVAYHNLGNMRNYFKHNENVGLICTIILAWRSLSMT